MASQVLKQHAITAQDIPFIPGTSPAEQDLPPPPPPVATKLASL